MVKERSREHRQHHNKEFRAPWGRSVKLNTVLVMMVFVVVLVVPLFVVPKKPDVMLGLWLAPAFVVAAFGVTALFAVCGFAVRHRELEIQRLIWKSRLSLKGLRMAYADPEAMKGSFRKAGNGGFLAYTGWFWNRRLGGYRAFVTDPKRCVVLRFEDRTLVVSPDDPERFLRALGFEPITNGGAG